VNRRTPAPQKNITIEGKPALPTCKTVLLMWRHKKANTGEPSIYRMIEDCSSCGMGKKLFEMACKKSYNTFVALVFADGREPLKHGDESIAADWSKKYGGFDPFNPTRIFH
jgi:hypothetical protein